jgi:hypothetical protein
MDSARRDDVIERLERHRQAATYSAVAGVVGASHRSVMAGCDRSSRNSWVVNKQTRRPTGYGPQHLHPDLAWSVEARGVLSTAEELADWLTTHP